MEKFAIGFPFLNWSECSILSLARVQRSLYLFMFSVLVLANQCQVYILPLGSFGRKMHVPVCVIVVAKQLSI